MLDYNLYNNELEEIEKNSSLEESMYALIIALLYTIPKFREQYVAINVANAKKKGKNDHLFFKNSDGASQCAVPDIVIFQRNSDKTPKESIVGAIEMKWYGYNNLEKCTNQPILQSEFYHRVLYSDGKKWMCYIDETLEWEFELNKNNWDEFLTKVSDLFLI